MADLLGQFASWAGMPDAAALEGWHLVAYPSAEAPQAIAAMSGTEVHFAADPGARHRVLQRHRAREFLAPLIERRGYLTTRVQAGDTSAHRFVSRLGFQKTWGDGAIDHYMLTALPFGKEH